MNPITQLTQLGQSLWYDNISRRELQNGHLANLIATGAIRGLTSNPSIFHNAIAKSEDYNAALQPLAWAGYNAEQIYEQLAIEDIQAAADLLLPLYTQTGGEDGYVSLEVSPTLAHDTAATLAEAERLWQRVDRPNLMIKIPATRAGLPAIRAAIAAGLNINVTLIFSIERYKEVIEAYLSGLEDRLAAGNPIANIASVASFFISRIDTKIDAKLPANSPLAGKAAIANAKLAYQEFVRAFQSPRFSHLAAQHARPQRPLWASTSTKNPAYRDILYVETLIGAQTVNTVPPQTLQAFLQHGTAALTIEDDLPAARETLNQLEILGISIARVTQELEEEGVAAFQTAFADLLAAIESRRLEAQNQLGPLVDTAARSIAQLQVDSVPSRLWAHDPSLWTTDPQGQKEISNRLGWLHLPETSQSELPRLEALAASLPEDFTHILLLGMGGSSLAPEVMSLILDSPLSVGEGQGVRARTFAILDSTNPDEILATARAFPPQNTLYIVASKSGGTAEVNAFFDYFWDVAHQTIGEHAPAHFIAITDPGTALDTLARQRNFRAVVNADPNVGGRFSAFTVFGLTAATLMGRDPNLLLARAREMMQQCRADLPVARNPGLALGAILGAAAQIGMDKLTLIADSPLKSFGSWLEQLIAESSGKQGVGIIPIDGEPLTAPASYASDRIFAYLRISGEFDEAVAALRAAGHPVLTFTLRDRYDLAAEFYRWEIATAAACMVLGVNAFDQPDVQDNKTRTKAKIAHYQQHGAFDEGMPLWTADGFTAYASPALTNALQGATTLPETLAVFCGAARRGDYIAINAYVPRNPHTETLLTQLRVVLRDKTGCATTVGFGPRFLHSTGQLHKGGADNGLFLQITADPTEDVEIPGQGLTFGALLRGQALGDFEALQARNRRVLRLHLSELKLLEKLI